MNSDIPPTDEEIVELLAAHPEGLTPRELVKSFETAQYMQHDVIKAIQRAFDRGIVQLSKGARLVCAEVDAAVAA